MSKQEFADKVTEFLLSNDLCPVHCITYIGNTDIILDINGENAKQLLSDWLHELKCSGQIIHYSEPEIDPVTLNISSNVTYSRNKPNIFAEYIWCVYTESDSVICDTLQEALEELRLLNKQTGMAWKLKQIKTEEDL